VRKEASEKQLRTTQKTARNLQQKFTVLTCSCKPGKDPSAGKPWKSSGKWDVVVLDFSAKSL